MVEILEEEKINWDMVRYWAHNLSLVDTEIVFKAYRDRFDHGDPEWPPAVQDIPWYAEEYTDQVREFCPLRKFLVVGVYEEGYQRYAEQYTARTPMEAELEVIGRFDDLIIAGVFSDMESAADTYYTRAADDDL